MSIPTQDSRNESTTNSAFHFLKITEEQNDEFSTKINADKKKKTRNDDKKKIEKNEQNIARVKPDRKKIRSNQISLQRNSTNLNHQTKQHSHYSILDNSEKHQTKIFHHKIQIYHTQQFNNS